MKICFETYNNPNGQDINLSETAALIVVFLGSLKNLKRVESRAQTPTQKKTKKPKKQPTGKIEEKWICPVLLDVCN